VDAFDLLRLNLSIHNIHATIGDRRAVVARADFRPPFDRQLLLGKLFDDAGFTPNAIALRATPLRPIVGEGRDGVECNDQRQMNRINKLISSKYVV